MTIPPHAREHWWHTALVLALCAVVALATVLIWRQVIPDQRSVGGGMLPSDPVATLVYRNQNAAGETTRVVDNLQIVRGQAAFTLLKPDEYAPALASVFDRDPASVDADAVSEMVATRLPEFALLRIAQVTTDATGVFTRTRLLYTAHPRGYDLLRLDDRTLDPPVPIYDATLAIGETRTTTGMLHLSIPYTATLSLEARGLRTTALGEHRDCAQLRSTFATDGFTNTSTDWLCPGLAGIASQASNGIVSELVGASSGSYTLTSDAPPPGGPSTSDRGPGRHGAFPTSLGEPLATRWAIRDATTQAHITAPVVAVGEPGTPDALLLVATFDGGLQAYDRTTHARRWRFQTGGAIYGAPVVASGLVYVASVDRRLYAIDLTSGALRWSIAAGDAFSAAVAVDGGVVFVGNEDRTLRALDAASGVLCWQRTVGDAIAATPVVIGDQVIVGSDDGAVYAFATTDGAPRWAHATGDAVAAAVLALGDTVVVGSHDGEIYMLAAQPATRTGEVRWRYDADAEITADMAYATGLVIAATAGDELRAVDATTGVERWRVTSSQTLYGAPLVVGDRVYINRGTNLMVIDLAAGRELPPIPIGETAAYASVASDGNELFVGHRSGFVRVLGAADATPWQPTPRWIATDLAQTLLTAREALTAPPVLVGDRLLTLTFGGSIVATSTSDGTSDVLGTIDLDTTPTFAPVVVGDTLVFVLPNGTVIGYDLAARAERWRRQLAQPVGAPPAVAGDRVLLTLAGPVALAIDAATGAEVWRRTLDPGFPGGAALLHNDTYYVAAATLTALDPTDGTIR